MKIPDNFIEERAKEYIESKVKPFTNFIAYLNYTWYVRNRVLKVKYEL